MEKASTFLRTIARGISFNSTLASRLELLAKILDGAFITDSEAVLIGDIVVLSIDNERDTGYTVMATQIVNLVASFQLLRREEKFD